MPTLLDIRDLCMSIADRPILKSLNLTLNTGEVHAVMGPNGAGKSTLAGNIVGNPHCTIERGEIYFQGQCINDVPVYERARRGIFLSFQTPEEVPGLSVEEFLRAAKEAVLGTKVSVLDFHTQLRAKLARLRISEAYASRGLNVGFSGGEKKKNEILQLAVLEPKLAILDETDSGLDVDATRIVFEGIDDIRTPDMGFLIITHHREVLEYIKPDVVHILVDGTIVKTGDVSLVHYVVEHGYADFATPRAGEQGGTPVSPE